MLTELYSLKDIRVATGIIPAGVFFRANEKDAVKFLRFGLAITGTEAHTMPWQGIQWSGCQVAILASGESLTEEVALSVASWRNKNPLQRKAIVINTTFKRAPWADVLYACDYPWWKKYINEVRASFKGELWTQDLKAQKDFGIRRIDSRRGKGLSLMQGVINQGDNGGYQAIGLAYQAGSRHIKLFGYDMHGGHWHGEHPDELKKANAYALWLTQFPALAKNLKLYNVEVINYNPKSALKVFPFGDIKEIL